MSARYKRIDKATAEEIDQAIDIASTAGAKPAVTFLYSRCVPIWIAHRVLAKPSRRSNPDPSQPTG